MESYIDKHLITSLIPSVTSVLFSSNHLIHTHLLLIKKEKLKIKFKIFYIDKLIPLVIIVVYPPFQKTKKNYNEVKTCD